MQSPEPFRIFTRKLHELGVPYMVSGSVAAIYYGEPRMTNDVDIIVFLKRQDARRLEETFSGDEFYCPPREVIEIESAREQRGHFNLIHHDTGFKADIYLMGRDELHEWGMARVQVADLDGGTGHFRAAGIRHYPQAAVLQRGWLRQTLAGYQPNGGQPGRGLGSRRS